MTDKEYGTANTELSKPISQTTNSTKMTQKKQSRLRTLTRFAVGGIALTMDGISNQMSTWNDVSDEQVYEIQPSTINYEITEITFQSQSEAINQSEKETTGQLARYALIGLAISAENRISSGFSLIGRVASRLSRAAKPITDPLSQSPGLHPVSKRYDKLANRGQAQVSQWINMGREEEKRSRQLVQAAVSDTMETSIEYIAEKPEIQELIQSQSTGLANEIVEEIRERTVSADTLAENILRSFLRLTPRSEISGPPMEVRIRALSLHPGSQGIEEKDIGDESANR